MSRSHPPAFMVLSLAIHVAAGAVVLGLGTAHDPAAEADPPPNFAGETFEIPELDPERAEESTSASPAAAKPSPARAPRPARAEPVSTTSKAQASDAPAAGGEASAPPLFGAVGERGVVDLATAFTRAFPQAASGDASWTRVPFGSAGTADVALEIDDTGHLVDTHVTGSPSSALRDGIQRTLVLIRARSFVATAAVTRLHIVSTVSPDATHDGLHGDVFAIGGSFAGREGSAFFALAMGRRIDLTITRK
ncbi:hypothetical protein LZC95_13165 [Pendulispora brunnea]|uniref:Uncharacterized protein n=1 Tax=Pendulispora brunnea TaxID=2905690 RepID=A0ABZ2KJM9_9BACT